MLDCFFLTFNRLKVFWSKIKTAFSSKNGRGESFIIYLPGGVFSEKNLHFFRPRQILNLSYFGEFFELLARQGLIHPFSKFACHFFGLESVKYISLNGYKFLAWSEKSGTDNPSLYWISF